MKFLLYLLLPLTWIYQFGFFLDRFFKRKHKIENSFIISVGNLTMGGTGKTPMTIYLAKLLGQIFSDYPMVVLSRGYRGSGTHDGMMVELDTNPSVCGDEPLLIKTKVPRVSVIIGKNRFESFRKFFPREKEVDNGFVKYDINGRFSPRFRSLYRNRFFLPVIEKFEPNSEVKLSDKKIIILDDGFQHHAIQRNLDFLLIDSDNAFGNGFTIPLGNLRERISAVKRVQYIFFTRYTKENSYNVEILKMKFLKLNKDLKFFHLAYKAEPIKNSQGNSISLEELKKRKLTMFSALGNPFSFENTIESFNPIELKKVRFPDHFLFDEITIRNLISKAGSDEILVCTEKDFIKIKNLKLSSEEFEKIYFLPIEVFIHKHFELKEDLEKVIKLFFKTDSLK